MLCTSIKNSRLLGCVVFTLTLIVIYPNSVSAKPRHNEILKTHSGTVLPDYNDTLPYPIHDRRGDFLSGSQRRTLDLNDPSNIRDSVVYDPVSKRYILYEKIGNRYYRSTTSYSFEEYWQIRNRQSEIEYFQKRSNTLSILNRGRVKPKLSLYDNLFNRLFGNGKINITPQGNVDITAGYQGQNIKNPTLPENA
ncbi:MAG TPA: hypothetical protein VK489_09175, partial [Ferruginibacter sp.]|nr:hypothetical protein [Ferruginibacter sp.]